MNLRLRWTSLMSELGLAENIETYDALMTAYSESHRHYHNVSHLQMVLTEFSKTAHLAENKSHVELALWFHDAIYKPFSTTNEKDSADWVADFLQMNNLQSAVITNVHRLVMATSHVSTSNRGDESLIIDIDLVVLGQPREVYEKYCRDVRKEYKWVPTIIYKSKRKALLEGFLARGKIYNCDAFNTIYGRNARLNLSAEIERL